MLSAEALDHRDIAYMRTDAGTMHGGIPRPADWPQSEQVDGPCVDVHAAGTARKRELCILLHHCIMMNVAHRMNPDSRVRLTKR
jgi:hypothetical protein